MKLNRIDGGCTLLSDLKPDEYFEFDGGVYVFLVARDYTDSSSWEARQIGHNKTGDYTYRDTSANETIFYKDREVHKVQILSLDYKRV